MTGSESIDHAAHESSSLQGRELFIHFPSGMGQSKLKVPFASTGTGRNLNSVGKLADMAARIANA